MRTDRSAGRVRGTRALGGAFAGAAGAFRIRSAVNPRHWSRGDPMGLSFQPLRDGAELLQGGFEVVGDLLRQHVGRR